MMKCNDIRARLSFYLDEELQGVERTDLEAHLGGCESCRVAVERERRFLDQIRAARPLYHAAPEFRTRIAESISSQLPGSMAPPELRERIERQLARKNRLFGLPWLHAPAFAVIGSLVMIGLLIGLLALIRNRNHANSGHASDFALMAVETHLRHARGQLPLEIASELPSQISQWFSGKLPFVVKLPNYQESSGQEKLYELEGARLVGYKEDYAAYVAYRMRTSPISLVITSDTTARPSGGEEILAKGITFHYNSINGLKVITWSDRGLTYALVSDLDERGQQSCLVCHEGVKDRDFIENLKPSHVSDARP